MQIGITLYTHQHTLEVSSTALKLDPYVDFHQEPHQKLMAHAGCHA